MAELAKILKDLLPAVNDVFGQELLRSRVIHTNLPADNIGFWLTQGVPFGLVMIHLLMAALGDRNVGRCFIPDTAGEPLAPSQVQYITEMCLDQAIHYDCFDRDGGIKAVCRASPCDKNDTIVATSIQHSSGVYFQTLFFYRYYVWFLLTFAFSRAFPQIVWTVFCKADVRKAIQDIAVIAEFQHAMCGVMSLVKGGDSAMMPHHHSRSPPGHSCPEWMEFMNRIVINEINKRASKKALYWQYVLRKVSDIILDVVIVAIFVWFQCDRTPFDKIIFLCDLHNDRDNIFLCDSFQKRFIPCTVSFGFEFVITAFVVFLVMIIDFLVQSYVTLKFTRAGHALIRTLTCGLCFSDAVLFWDPFISQELELNRNNQWTCFDQSFMESPNDLYLVGLMYRQNDVSHGHFLKMMSEKMIEQLHPAFDYLRQQSGANVPNTATIDTASEDINSEGEEGIDFPFDFLRSENHLVSFSHN